MTSSSAPEHTIVLLGLYSERYPAIGESHGLSVAAGSLQAAFAPENLAIHVLDMAEWGEEGSDRAVELIRRTGADALAIGLPYGTFTSMTRHFPRLRAALRGTDPLVVFGGALATYLSDRILGEVDGDAVVIIGEADVALPGVVGNWMRGLGHDDVPNLHFAAGRTRRELVDLAKPVRPYRGHVRGIYDRGGQVFMESSRGCSWSACTFCLRGLTDVAGRSHEYRRKPAEQVAAELNELAGLGITNVTFADEDFLGGPLEDCREFVAGLAANRRAFPAFDVSLTVHSAWSRRDTPEQDTERADLLRELVGLGLRKVFLGIESCSPGQLKRYAKGHDRRESAAAVDRLKRMGVRVEIGFILFDPLCDLDEVKDSLGFIRRHGMAALASGLSSHLRLQTGSRYLALLGGHERRSGRTLRDPDLDPDTLTHRYAFADERVARLFAAVSDWNDRLHPLYYPAKSLSRASATGVFGANVGEVREAVACFRDDQCDAILAAIGALERGSDPDPILGMRLTGAAAALASVMRRALDGLDSRHAGHPVVRAARDALTKEF